MERSIWTILILAWLAMPLAAPAQSTNNAAGLTNAPASPNHIEPLQPLKPLQPLRPLGPAGSGGSASAAASEGAPLKITTFVTSQVPQAFIEEKTGLKYYMRYFRAQFKILDPTATSLDPPIVHLFDQKKQPVRTLTDYSPQATISGTNVKENMLAFPNLLSNVTGLEKNKTYNIVFMHRQGEFQFKYAIVVLGAKGKTVADIIPGSGKIDDFTFEGKDKLVK